MKVLLRDYLNKMRALIDAGETGEAIALGQHCLRYYPKQIDLYRLLGEACLDSKAPDAAQDLFQRVLSADPENVVAHVGQALVCEQRGETENAQHYIQRAYELQPNNPHIRREYERLLPPPADDETQVKLTPAALARLYLIEEMYQSARQELDVLVRDDPTRYDLRVALAEALFRLGQLRECAKQAQEILTTLPYCVKANLLLGYAWVESGVREGEVYMKRAREIDPEGIFARYLFGERTLIKFEKPQLPSVEEAEAQAGKEVGAILAAEPADLAASLSTFEASLVRDETQTTASPDAKAVALGETEAGAPAETEAPAQGERPARAPLPTNRPLIATAMNRLPSWLLEEIAETQPTEPVTAEKEPAAALAIEPAVTELPPAEQVTPAVEPVIAEAKPAAEALPTWVEEIGQREPAQPVELEAVHDMLVPGETLQAEEQPYVEPAVTEPVAESLTTAPLAGTPPTAAVEAPVAEGETFPYPDWLAQIAAAATQPGRAVEETAPIKAPVVEQPMAPEPVQTPDWVQEIAHPPAVEPISAQESVDEPAYIEPARLERIFAQEPAAVIGEAVPYPDWLMNLAAAQPGAVETPPAVPVEPEKKIEVTAPVEAPVAEQPIVAGPVQTPDWVQEIAHPSTVEPAHVEPLSAQVPKVEPAHVEQIQEEPAAVSGEEVPYPDWVQETAHPVAEHAPEPAEPVQTPDWVQEIVHPQTVEPSRVEPISAQESVIEPAYVEPARVEAIPAEGPAVVSEEVIPYPDWLINLSVIQPAAAVEMPPAVSVEPEKQIEVAAPVEAPVVEQAIAHKPVMAEENAPAIAVEPVKEVEPVAPVEEPTLQPSEVAPEPAIPVETQTPAWLQEIVAKQKAETLSADTTSPASYPDWLVNLPAPGTTPASVTSPSPVESGTGSMPEYMDNLSAAAREPSPAAPTREPEPTPLPAWMTAPSEPASQAEIAPTPPAPPARAGNVPEWIKTLSAEQAREPEPTPQPPVETTAPERPAPGKLDVESLLRHARSMAETPNLSGAVKEYEYILHRAPSALQDIISDLEHMLTLPKFPHSAHRVLGDAYSLAGRYKESVEQYRQVLGRWQR